MLWDDVLPRMRSRIQSLHQLDVELVDIQHVGGGAVSPEDSHLDGRAHLCHLDMIRDCHRGSCGTFLLVSNFRQALRDVGQLLLLLLLRMRLNRTETRFISVEMMNVDDHYVSPLSIPAKRDICFADAFK